MGMTVDIYKFMWSVLVVELLDGIIIQVYLDSGNFAPKR